ncbi:MAG TPA: hypothetical protein VHE55_18570 [Fimbriimonadaceae bacterium]|nr:hypothetical protein [Fimbriimonadaceae bacterium]
MSQPAKVGLAILAAIVGVFIVLKIVGVILSTLLSFIIPLAILGGIGLVVYSLVTRNSLPGGRRYLP